ncbi:MAG: NYN domain-containing protein [Planctomycetota bacterium]
MARLYLLIDGYNLLLSGGSGRAVFAPGSLQQHRNQLLISLRNWLDADIAAHACIVFDSRRTPHAACRNSSSSDLPANLPFQVIFAVNHPTADDEIEEQLRQHSSPRQVLVVSSDHQLQRAASRRRACWMDSQRFLELLESGSPRALRAVAAKRSSRKPGTRPAPPDKPAVLPELVDDLADVYEEFSRIDVESLSARKQPTRHKRPRR